MAKERDGSEMIEESNARRVTRAKCKREQRSSALQRTFFKATRRLGEGETEKREKGEGEEERRDEGTDRGGELDSPCKDPLQRKRDKRGSAKSGRQEGRKERRDGGGSRWWRERESQTEGTERGERGEEERDKCMLKEETRAAAWL